MTARTQPLPGLKGKEAGTPPESRLLLRHALAYFFAKASPGALNFVALAVYTRLLSPGEYGRYTLAWAAVCLADALLFQWLRLAMWRFLPLYDANSKTLLRVVLLTFLGLSFLTVLGSGPVLVVYYSASWRNLFLVSLVLLWFHSWFELNLALTNARLEPMRYGAFSALRAGVGLGVGVALAKGGYGALGPVLGLVAGAAAGSLGLSIGKWPGLDRTAECRATLRELFHYGAPFTGSSAFNFIVHLTDRFILGTIISASAAGLYAAGFDFAQQSVGMLMMTVNLAGYPLITRDLETRGDEAGRRRLNDVGNLLLAIAVPAALGLAVFSKEASTWVLGAAFRQTGAMLIPIVALAGLLGGIKSFYADLAFQLGRKTVDQLRVAGLAAAVSLGMNFLLIPVFGVLGAATSNLAAQATGLIASLLLGRRIWRVPCPSELLKICTAAGLMIGVVGALRTAGLTHPALLLTIAAIGYIVSAQLLGVSAVRLIINRSALQGLP